MSHQDSIKTRTVRAALETDTQHGAVVPPIHLTSTFAFSGYGEKREYDYSRSGNPTRDALGRALADLEGGAGAVVTASGMGAVSLVTQLFKPDQVAVVPHDCYGGTYRLFNALNLRGALHGTVRRLPGRRRRSTRRSRTSRRWCGSRRRATRCCASSTSRPLRPGPRQPVRWWRPTTRSCRPCGSSRWHWGPTSSFIRRPST